MSRQLNVAEINGKKVRYVGTFHSAMSTKLTLLDRIKILFGQELLVRTTNYTLQTQNRITGTQNHAVVLPSSKIRKMFAEERAKEEQKKTA